MNKELLGLMAIGMLLRLAPDPVPAITSTAILVIVLIDLYRWLRWKKGNHNA